MTHTIDLTVGYEAGGVLHTRVTFGRRLTGGDLMNIDSDPQSDIATQHQLLILRGGITEFGTLPTTDAKGNAAPVPLPVFLALDSVDIEDLVRANNEFLDRGLDGRKAEFISESEVKLAVGHERGGIVYNRARFGRRVIGLDMVEADKKGYEGLRRECFLVGREIASLSTDDGAHSIDGPVELQVFEQLDGNDIVTLRQASAIWRGSFRRSGGRVQKEVGAESAAAGGTDGVEQG